MVLEERTALDGNKERPPLDQQRFNLKNGFDTTDQAQPGARGQVSQGLIISLEYKLPTLFSVSIVTHIRPYSSHKREQVMTVRN